MMYAITSIVKLNVELFRYSINSVSWRQNWLTPFLLSTAIRTCVSSCCGVPDYDTIWTLSTSKEECVSFFTMSDYGDCDNTWSDGWIAMLRKNILLSPSGIWVWRWRQFCPSKHWYQLTRLCDVNSEDYSRDAYRVLNRKCYNFCQTGKWRLSHEWHVTKVSLHGFLI
jgi:hypothetical protein